MGAATAQAGGRREERKAQNRAKLLEAARKVFAEKGLGEATARDIVRETDLASGTFERGFFELFEPRRPREDAGDPPAVDLDYLATATVAIGFQIATHLVD